MHSNFLKSFEGIIQPIINSISKRVCMKFKY